jgi:DNA-binding CsgD family transcriptional regulator
MAAMVGRDRELASVVGSLTAREVSLTWVMGEGGIGKSRLVAETVEATPERLTLSGGCLPLRHTLPLLPIVDALDTGDPTGRKALTRAARSLPGSLRPHVAGVMPRTLPEEIRPAEEVRRDQLFLATEALLSRVADERPVTLVVEDVHWADPGNNARGSGLTAQETQVLRLLAGGFTNAEIGTALFISPKTASVHVTHLLRKLQLSNRTQAAVWATRHGLTSDP